MDEDLFSLKIIMHNLLINKNIFADQFHQGNKPILTFKFLNFPYFTMSENKKDQQNFEELLQNQQLNFDPENNERLFGGMGKSLYFQMSHFQLVKNLEKFPLIILLIDNIHHDSNFAVLGKCLVNLQQFSQNLEDTVQDENTEKFCRYCFKILNSEKIIVGQIDLSISLVKRQSYKYIIQEQKSQQYQHQQQQQQFQRLTKKQSEIEIKDQIVQAENQFNLNTKMQNTFGQGGFVFENSQQQQPATVVSSNKKIDQQKLFKSNEKENTNINNIGYNKKQQNLQLNTKLQRNSKYNHNPEQEQISAKIQLIEEKSPQFFHNFDNNKKESILIENQQQNQIKQQLRDSQILKINNFMRDQEYQQQQQQDSHHSRTNQSSKTSSQKIQHQSKSPEQISKTNSNIDREIQKQFPIKYIQNNIKNIDGKSKKIKNHQDETDDQFITFKQFSEGNFCPPAMFFKKKQSQNKDQSQYNEQIQQQSFSNHSSQNNYKTTKFQNNNQQFFIQQENINLLETKKHNTHEVPTKIKRNSAQKQKANEQKKQKPQLELMDSSEPLDPQQNALDQLISELIFLRNIKTTLKSPQKSDQQQLPQGITPFQSHQLNYYHQQQHQSQQNVQQQHQGSFKVKALSRDHQQQKERSIMNIRASQAMIQSQIAPEDYYQDDFEMISQGQQSIVTSNYRKSQLMQKVNSNILMQNQNNNHIYKHQASSPKIIQDKNFNKITAHHQPQKSLSSSNIIYDEPVFQTTSYDHQTQSQTISQSNLNNKNPSSVQQQKSQHYQQSSMGQQQQQIKLQFIQNSSDLYTSSQDKLILCHICNEKYESWQAQEHFKNCKKQQSQQQAKLQHSKSSKFIKDNQNQSIISIDEVDEYYSHTPENQLTPTHKQPIQNKSTENKFRSDEFTSTNKTSELLRQFGDNYSEDFEIISENESSNIN